MKKILLFFLLFFFFTTQFLFPLNRKYNERQLISAFLYNIAKFIKWDNKKKNILIYIISSKEIHKYFAMLDGKTINNLKIKVVFPKNFKDIKRADILYIDKTFTKLQSLLYIEKIISSMKNNRIFTASNIKGFANSFGILEFYKFKDYIRFKINIKNLKKTGIFLSSEVLELAKIVE